VNVAASSEESKFTTIPARESWRLTPDAAYVHLCTNETIGGVEYHFVPDVGDVPIVADMSSHILSRSIDVSKYGVIYGGAQKNIGPAGLTVVIVREDLLGHALTSCPSAFDWKVVAEHGSMYNTPPTYAIYIAGLVFQWLKREGGVAAMEQRNIRKASLLYNYLDSTDFYRNSVAENCRSRMNVPFALHDESLNESFLAGAKERGLLQLKGHKSVGGMRASIYNAMPFEGVQALVEYLKEFEKK
jgi:phosphoserine aminotransferase